MERAVPSVKPENLGALKFLNSCRCSEHILKDCTFFVSVKTSSDFVDGKGSKLKSVFIKCNCCNKTSNRDLETFDIYESDINF